MITASGGTGATSVGNTKGGNGSVGRIRIEAPIITGSTNDPASSDQLGGNLWAGGLALTG